MLYIFVWVIGCFSLGILSNILFFQIFTFHWYLLFTTLYITCCFWAYKIVKLIVFPLNNVAIKMTVQQQIQQQSWTFILSSVNRLSKDIISQNELVQRTELIQSYQIALDKQQDKFSKLLASNLQKLLRILENQQRKEEKFVQICTQLRIQLEQKIKDLKSPKFQLKQIFNKDQFNIQSLMRSIILQKYQAKEFKIERKSGKIQGIIILNNKIYDADQASQMLENITKKFYVFTNEPKQVLENLVVISGPNAGTIEHYGLCQTLLQNFLNKKFNVVLWNYYGYNQEDTNNCSLDQIKQNLQDLIEILKSSCDLKKLILYGKSLGGFTTVQNTQQSDHIIVDRSFWDISVLARLKANFLLQMCFDFFIQNFFYFGNFLQCKGSVCFIYDPEDQIIPLEGSPIFGFLYITSQIYFEQFLNSQMSQNYAKTYFKYFPNLFKKFILIKDYFNQKQFVQEFFEKKIKCNLSDIIEPLQVVIDKIEIPYNLEMNQFQNYSDLEITKFYFIKSQIQKFKKKIDLKKLKDVKEKLNFGTEALFIKVLFSLEQIQSFQLSLFDILINDKFDSRLLSFFYWGFVLQNNLVLNSSEKDKQNEIIQNIQKEICSIYLAENEGQVCDPILTCILQRIIIILDHLKLLAQVYLKLNKQQSLANDDIINMNFFDLKNIIKKVKFVKVQMDIIHTQQVRNQMKLQQN